MADATGVVAYLDSSAIVKLATRESETGALRTELAHWPQHASSRLAEIEVRRAALDAGHTARKRARDVLRAISLIAIDDAIVEAASVLLPPFVRSLDAIHVASAMALADDLGVLITYDRRMQRAAMTYNVPILAPGQSERVSS
jgi:predicted nucleic acid-binding protein